MTRPPDIQKAHRATRVLTENQLPPESRHRIGTLGPNRELTSTDRFEKIVLLGASTGGIDALLHVLSSFPTHCPPTIIVQHTGTGFGESLAALLDRRIAPKVNLIRNRTPLCAGTVFLGAGQTEHLVVENGSPLTVSLKNLPPVSGHLPSVDVLFRSAVDIGSRVTAALLTGMGRDGASGLKELKKSGTFTIAQDEPSSVVYGMPRAAAEMDAAVKILPLEQIGPELLKNATNRNTNSELHK